MAGEPAPLGCRESAIFTVHALPRVGRLRQRQSCLHVRVFRVHMKDLEWKEIARFRCKEIAIPWKQRRIQCSEFRLQNWATLYADFPERRRIGEWSKIERPFPHKHEFAKIRQAG